MPAAKTMPTEAILSALPHNGQAGIVVFYVIM
jgi:hypothetical protein